MGKWDGPTRHKNIVLNCLNTISLFIIVFYRNILNGEYSEISALTVEGGTVWMGTRNGFIMLLDAAAIAGQDQEEALKAMQYCGEGRVKSIVSLSPRGSNAASLKVSLILFIPHIFSISLSLYIHIKEQYLTLFYILLLLQF